MGKGFAEMRPVYQWRELTPDGLLKLPRGVPNHEDETPNDHEYGWFNSEPEAEKFLAGFCSRFHLRGIILTLVKIHTA